VPLLENPEWYDPPETLNMANSTSQLNTRSEFSETLLDDRSSSHENLREVSRSDLAYGFLDLRNIESPSHTLTTEIVATYSK
jgi:hypothetical protein